ncbi:MAG: DUF3810 domain-containing protein [Clostridia bacterium]|nr:DUF3810 domain-containing protein [Clostridia bacterium]
MKKKQIFNLSLVGLLLIAAVLRRAFDVSESFSEVYTLSVAPILKFPLSFITSFLPFSVFESAIVIFALITVIFFLSLLKRAFFKLIKKECVSYHKVYFKIICYCLIFAFLSFVFTFESSYTRKSIDSHIGLESVEMNAENVALALDRVIEETEKLAEEIDYVPTRPTVLKMSFKELAKAILEATEKAEEKYGYLQSYSYPAKPIAFSLPLAYTGISGIYGYFTGEANINTEFADYSLPFTMAHEYSHQRGIGPENEAEFSAFLICMESSDPYIRYSAYSQVAITLSNLLYEYDEELFYNAFMRFPDVLYYDVYHSSKTYEEYSKTPVDEVASAINNTYLLSNGDEGVISYSLSAQLYTAYLLKE